MTTPSSLHSYLSPSTKYCFRFGMSFYTPTTHRLPLSSYLLHYLLLSARFHPITIPLLQYSRFTFHSSSITVHLTQHHNTNIHNEILLFINLFNIYTFIQTMTKDVENYVTYIGLDVYLIDLFDFANAPKRPEGLRYGSRYNIETGNGIICILNIR